MNPEKNQSKGSGAKFKSFQSPHRRESENLRRAAPEHKRLRKRAAGGGREGAARRRAVVALRAVSRKRIGQPPSAPAEHGEGMCARTWGGGASNVDSV